MNVSPKIVIGISAVSLIGMAVLLPYMKPHRDSFELAYFLAQTLLVGVAVGALLYARDQVTHMRGQLKEAEDSRRATLLVAKANFLLEMDRRWDSPDLIEGFSGIKRLKRQTEGDVEKFTRAVTDLRVPDTMPEYRKIMNVLGFFETLGLLLKREYVDESDLDSLFGGAIVEAGTLMKPHIEARRHEGQAENMPVGMWENAVYLIDRMTELAAKR